MARSYAPLAIVPAVPITPIVPVLVAATAARAPGSITPTTGTGACCCSVASATLQRSEEHTSELQSLRHLVCRLLLEKKKKRRDTILTVEQCRTDTSTSKLA